MNTENSGIRNKNIYKWKNYLKLPYIGVLLIATGTFLPCITVNPQQGFIAKTAIGNGYGVILLILCVLIIKFLKSNNYIGIIVCGVIDVYMLRIIPHAIYRNAIAEIEDFIYGFASIFNAQEFLKSINVGSKGGSWRGDAEIGFWLLLFGGLIVTIDGVLEFIKNRKKIQVRKQ